MKILFKVLPCKASCGIEVELLGGSSVLGILTKKLRKLGIGMDVRIDGGCDIFCFCFEAVQRFAMFLNRCIGFDVLW